MKRATNLQKNLAKKVATLMPMTRSQQKKSTPDDEQKTASQKDNAADDVHDKTDDENNDQAAPDNDIDNNEKDKGDSRSTARRRRKQTLKQLAASAHRFNIDGGFLYFDSPSDGMVMCVPDGMSADSMKVVRTDDDTDESYEHKCQMTLRERIIDELHSTPMSGHRGYHATVDG